MKIEPRLVALSKHPRSGRAIRRAKARGGLIAFFVTALVGYLHGSPFGATMSRALLAGLAGYVVVWAAAIAIWRHVLAAEVRAVLRRRSARRVSEGRDVRTGRKPEAT